MRLIEKNFTITLTRWCQISGLLSAGAMALWHGVEFYEKEKVVGEEYYQQWPNVSTFSSTAFPLQI